MEKKLIRLMLSHGFWEGNKHRIVRAMFPNELATIYDTIAEAHERYGRDLTLDEIRATHLVGHPTLTRAARQSLQALFDDIAADGAIGADVGQDVLCHLWRAEIGRRVGEYGLDLVDGKQTDLLGLQRLVESVGADFLPREDGEPVTDDIDEVLEALDRRASWQFNLQALAFRVDGISGGEFGIIFARPEVGKTGLWVSLCAGPGGFCEQGARVHAIVNEEPGIRTRMRAISARTGLTRTQIRENRDEARRLYQPIKGRLEIVDDVTMTIEALDGYCRRHKPDILVVDQLDKLGIGGQFARPDERLREVYRRFREILKIHGCAGFGLSQASAEGEGRTKLHYSMMENSRTGKAAEADIIMGVGKEPMTDNTSGDDPARFITLSKNKLTGWHGTVVCVLDQELSRYLD